MNLLGLLQQTADQWVTRLLTDYDGTYPLELEDISTVRSPSAASVNITQYSQSIGIGIALAATAALGIVGQQPTVKIGYVAQPSAGTVATESTGWPFAKVETATNLGGGYGGTLLALNSLLEPASGVTSSPSSGTVTIAGQQVTLSLGGNRQPSTGSLSLTGQTPTRLENSNRLPSAGSVALTGQTPTRAENSLRSPLVGSVTASGYAPTALQNSIRLPSVGSLSLTGYAPTVLAPSIATPSVGAVTLTGYAPSPSVSSGGGGGYGGLLAALALNFEPLTVRAPSNGAVSFTGYAPTLSFTGGSSGSGLLAALGSLTQSAALSNLYQPGSGTLSFTGYAPTPSRVVNDLGWDEFVSGPSTVSGTGAKGAVYDPRFAYPTTGSLSLTGYAPALLRSQIVSPAAGSLSLAGLAPTLTRNFVITPSTGVVSVTGSAGYGYGLLRYGRDVYGVTRYEYVAANSGPQTGTVTLIGYRPAVLQQFTVLPSSGAVGITGHTPVIPITVTPPVGSLSLTGYAPSAQLANPGRLPLSGAINLTGYAPTILRGYTNLPSVWQMGRAFIEVYTDVSASFNAISGNSTVVFDIGTEVASGDFISGNATVAFRQWANQTVTTNIWTDQGTASGEWTELTPNTDVWNG